MVDRLAGKVVVVTGATGIAAAGAELFGHEGASVHVVSLDEQGCASLVGRLQAAEIESSWFSGDLRREDQAEEAFAAALESFGHIDGLFAVAGGSGRQYGDGPTAELPLEGWDQTLALNATPAFLATRQAIRAMEDVGGSVVLVSSVLAEHPSRLFSTHAYAASKGAINSLAKTAAAFYADRRIRVNVVAPGLVRTPMSERAASDPETMAYVRTKQPLAEGMIEPIDVASSALFLLSDESANVTGQVIAVDGGWSAVEARA